MNSLRSVTLALGFAFIGCTRAQAQAPAARASTSAPSATDAIYGSGTLEADRTAPMAFDRAGTLRELHATVGDIVAADALLARIDDGDSTLAVQRERAAFEAERATLLRLRADESLVESRLRIASRDSARSRRLFEQGASSAVERDHSDDVESVTGLELAALRAQRPALRARAAQASSRLAQAEWSHGRDTLRAPMRARVLRSELAPGAFVGAGQTVLTLAPLGAEVAAVWVHERELPALRVGARVRVTLRDLARTQLEGAVLRVRPEADGRTHEARVDVALRDLPPTVVFGVRLDAAIARSPSP